jgi:hypothetical protein
MSWMLAIVTPVTGLVMFRNGRKVPIIAIPAPARPMFL